MGIKPAGKGRCRAESFDNGFCQSFADELRNYIGRKVIIFTTGGGPSGYGFEGILMNVNSCFARVSNHQGRMPGNLFGDAACVSLPGALSSVNTLWNSARSACVPMPYPPVADLGSVCDIPIDKIAAFCHDAV